MRHFAIVTGFVLAGLLCGQAGAEGIWQWTHEASGSGTANVFDGGPLVFDSDSTFGTTDSRMSFIAVDQTFPGSMGADAMGAGRSHILPSPEDTFRFRVDLIAGYFPSVFPGGDNPGGLAEAELSSVIDFVMPADEVQWNYQLLIDQTGAFEGFTHVILENVSQSQTLLELTSEVFAVKTTLTADMGDLVRITSIMSGSGSKGPGSSKEYEVDLEMIFVVPEPGALMLMAVGVLLTPGGVRRRSRSRGNTRMNHM